jgi:hypothetical protein
MSEGKRSGVTPPPATKSQIPSPFSVFDQVGLVGRESVDSVPSESRAEGTGSASPLPHTRQPEASKPSVVPAQQKIERTATSWKKLVLLLGVVLVAWSAGLCLGLVRNHERALEATNRMLDMPALHMERGEETKRVVIEAMSKNEFKAETALQRHVAYFSRLFPGNLSALEIEAIHGRLGMTGFRIFLKSNVIVDLADNVLDLTCVRNPAATGLYDPDTGELDAAAWARLEDMSRTDEDGNKWVSHSILHRLVRPVDPGQTWPRRIWDHHLKKCVVNPSRGLNPVPKWPVDWPTITAGSLSETFQMAPSRSVDGTPEWSLSDLRSFYNHTPVFWEGRRALTAGISFVKDLPPF